MAAQAQRSAPVSGKIWTGRILSTLVALFMLFDVWGKYAKPAPVVQAFAAMHIPIADAPIIGTLALICIVLYAIPRTAPLGAVLLTGYLGGATATNFLLGMPVFNVLFPVIFGMIAWVGLGLRDRRAVALLAYEE